MRKATKATNDREPNLQIQMLQKSRQESIRKSRTSYLNHRHARHFFRQLIEGIEFIHSKQIAHRDIKIENLLVTKDFLLKIADFGLATNSHKNGVLRKMIGFTGTRGYMPPEMYEGPYRLFPVDVYACGITLIEMINGKHPWDEPLEKDLKYRMFLNGSMKHSIEWEEMPRELNPLLYRILCPDPKNRATISEIRQDSWYQLGCAETDDWTNLRRALRKIDAEERKERKKGRYRGFDIDVELQKQNDGSTRLYCLKVVRQSTVVRGPFHETPLQNSEHACNLAKHFPISRTAIAKFCNAI
ncbi:hypothetical protein L596_028200 [Steinernema carpocapsae]|uniref:non-specific serine/threonine protein kinase n=1 Tax=Steinernema carpocapsae TaxID=34508 RepID=A0A4U5LXU5_STECR|nr:hypothetical protein L596_028200 [Steinernema carpocapsae]